MKAHFTVDPGRSAQPVRANPRKSRAQRGVTLIELVVVVAVIGILALIAMPSFIEQLQTTRRADAQGALLGLHNAMERFFTENNTYLGAAAGGGNTGAPTIFPSTAPVDEDAVYYNLTIQAATANTHTLRATPVGAQADNGMLEMDSNGARRWDRNDDGDFADADETEWD